MNSASAARPASPAHTSAISLKGLTKRFGKTEVLRGLDLDIEPNTVVGLFGRNGVGKTTLMSILSNQERATTGEALIFGEPVWENPRAMSHVCFIRENQNYPDESRLKQVLRAASVFYPNWDDEFASYLKNSFRLPEKTAIKKFSRGQLSALGIVIALASRAPVTFLDEPYLGLDPTARDMFYDLIIKDVGEHPRTMVFSTHLIDEAANLFERVVVLDEGKIVLNTSLEEATASAFNIAGPALAVDQITRGMKILKERALGGLKSVTISGEVTATIAEAASRARLEISPVSLQDLVSALGHHEDTSSVDPYGSATTKDTSKVKEFST